MKRQYNYRQARRHLCELCGNKARANHHIDLNPSNNDDNNLIFLCQSCHILIHNIFRQAARRTSYIKKEDLNKEGRRLIRLCKKYKLSNDDEIKMTISFHFMKPFERIK